MVSVRLDDVAGRAMRQVTRENLGKPMAIVLYEKGKGEAISVATIQGEFGTDFQITGNFTPQETADMALLTRAGALAAPMEIIEERTIGPSLGADNIDKGFNSVIYGFSAIAVFMCAYYLLFGVFSTVALAFNLLCLVAVLSMLQATLTLPGIAAIALTLGMAIDANVLINERVREELRSAVRRRSRPSTSGYECRLGHDPRLQHHHADRRPGAADLRLGPGARFRRGALPGHPDQHVLGGDVLARPGQPLVRAAEAAQERVDRPGLAARWPPASTVAD